MIVLESAAGLGLIFPGEAMAVIAGAMAVRRFLFTVDGIRSGSLGRDDWRSDRLYDRSHQRTGRAGRDGRSRAANMKSIASASSTTSIITAARRYSSDASSRWDALSCPSRRVCPGCESENSCRCRCSAGLVWSSVTVGLGYTLGSNWSLIEKWLKSLSAGIVVLAILTGLMARLWRSVSRRQTQIVAAWNRHLTGRYGFDLTPFVNFVRTRFSPRSYLGLHLTVGLIAVTALAWLFGGIVDIISDQGPLGGLDRTRRAIRRRSAHAGAGLGRKRDRDARQSDLAAPSSSELERSAMRAGARQACLSRRCCFLLAHTYSPSACRRCLRSTRLINPNWCWLTDSQAFPAPR